MNQPEPTLRVRQRNSSPPREFSAHPTIDPAPEPGHRRWVVHAISNHKGWFVDPRLGEKLRDVGRRMLAVAIHSECPRKPQLGRATPTRKQGPALPNWLGESHKLRA